MTCTSGASTTSSSPRMPTASRPRCPLILHPTTRHVSCIPPPDACPAMFTRHPFRTLCAQIFKHGVARFDKESVEEHPHPPKTPSAYDAHTPRTHPVLPASWRHTSPAESAPTTKGHSHVAHPHHADETIAHHRDLNGHHADLQVQAIESFNSR